MSGGEHVPSDPDQNPAHGREADDGNIWFTIAQAASFLGCSPQTIYSWERRRRHLTEPQHDEDGRRIYTQQQIAAAHRRARLNARAVQRRAAVA